MDIRGDGGIDIFALDERDARGADVVVGFLDVVVYVLGRFGWHGS